MDWDPYEKFLKAGTAGLQEAAGDFKVSETLVNSTVLEALQ